jgi:hypothetical protein
VNAAWLALACGNTVASLFLLFVYGAALATFVLGVWGLIAFCNLLIGGPKSAEKA